SGTAQRVEAHPADAAAPAETAAPTDFEAATAAPVAATGGEAVPLRRGLPRTVGADPWPPAGEATDRWARVEPPVAPTIEPTAPEPSPTAALIPVETTIRDDSARSATAPAATAEPKRVFGLRIRTVVLGGIALVAIAVIAVLAAQWFRAQPFGQDFIATY